MTPLLDSFLLQNRRQFFGQSALGLGTAALTTLLNESQARVSSRLFKAKAKRVIYLFQYGGPAQM